jgi:NitT/TauT family transport system substrate-binding protein
MGNIVTGGNMKTLKCVVKKAAWLGLAMICLSALFSTPATAKPLNYRLKWLFNASVVGDIYADVHGYFKEAGLDIRVKPGGPERDAIKELELGQATFGVASADQVIRALSKGAPVVVIAQIFQVNPMHWMYRTKDISIEKLDDLRNKIIGVTFGGNDEIILRTLMAKGNITEKDTTLFSARYDYNPFYQKKVELWPVYLNTQAVFLKKKLAQNGEAVSFFNPADYGVQFVSNSVVTSQKMMDEHPETVKAFVSSLCKAWEAALAPENAEKTIKTLQQFDKDTALDVMTEQLEVTRRLIKPTADLQIGTIDLPAWQQTAEIMADQKQTPRLIAVANAIHPIEK